MKNEGKKGTDYTTQNQKTPTHHGPLRCPFAQYPCHTRIGQCFGVDRLGCNKKKMARAPDRHISVNYKYIFSINSQSNCISPSRLTLCLNYGSCLLIFNNSTVAAKLLGGGVIIIMHSSEIKGGGGGGGGLEKKKKNTCLQGKEKTSSLIPKKKTSLR